MRKLIIPTVLIVLCLSLASQAKNVCSELLASKYNLYEVVLEDATESQHWLKMYIDGLDFSAESLELLTTENNPSANSTYTLTIKAPAGVLNRPLGTEADKMIRNVTRLGSAKSELPLYGSQISLTEVHGNFYKFLGLNNEEGTKANLFKIVQLLPEGIYILGEGDEAVSLFIDTEWVRSEVMYSQASLWSGRNFTLNMSIHPGVITERPRENRFLEKALFSLSTASGFADDVRVSSLESASGSGVLSEKPSTENGFLLQVAYPYGIPSPEVAFIYDESGNIESVRFDMKHRNDLVVLPVSGFIPRIQ